MRTRIRARPTVPLITTEVRGRQVAPWPWFDSQAARASDHSERAFTPANQRQGKWTIVTAISVIAYSDVRR